MGVKENADCESCKRPEILSENEIVLQIYNCNPVIPIPMTEGLVMLDIQAAACLMEIYEVEDKVDVMERIVKLHEFMQRKEIKK